MNSHSRQGTGTAPPGSCLSGAPAPVSAAAAAAAASSAFVETAVARGSRRNGGGSSTRAATALRQRIADEGPRALSDLELLALVVGHGSTGERVWRTVRALAARADLPELALLDCEGLAETPGIKPAHAALVCASFELGRRLYRPEAGPRALSQASDVHVVARDLELARREHFVAFYLDARNRVLIRETISVGSLCASIVHPREVFAPAIERRAASIILAHNHPSGDPEPSADDLALTRRLVQAGVLLGIEILDHLVIGHGIYVSLKSRGLM
jgi:DNA repair protein RadC